MAHLNGQKKLQPGSTVRPHSKALRTTMPSAKTVVKVVAAAIAAGAAMFAKMSRNGVTDTGFMLAMSIAGVVAIAIVAPRFFEGKQDGADFSEELEALHKPEVGEVNKQK